MNFVMLGTITKLRFPKMAAEERLRLAEAYARRFEAYEGMETIGEYSEQAARDTRDRKIKKLIQNLIGDSPECQ